MLSRPVANGVISAAEAPTISLRIIGSPPAPPHRCLQHSRWLPRCRRCPYLFRPIRSSGAWASMSPHSQAPAMSAPQTAHPVAHETWSDGGIRHCGNEPKLILQWKPREQRTWGTNPRSRTFLCRRNEFNVSTVSFCSAKRSATAWIDRHGSAGFVRTGGSCRNGMAARH